MNAHDRFRRGREPHQAIRRFHRGRPHQLRGAPRRDLRFPRSQRRRQIDDDPHAVRTVAAHVGTGVSRESTWRARAGSRAAAHRLHVPEVLALQRSDGDREPALVRRAVQRARDRSGGAHRLGARDGGLEGREDADDRHAAGGWKQRLALGCAVLHRPPIIFLDEPTSGVDPISRRQFWELIHQMAADGRDGVRHHALHGRGGVLQPLGADLPRHAWWLWARRPS